MTDNSPTDTDPFEDAGEFFNNDRTVLTRHSYEFAYGIDCPYCDRVEEFDSQFAARIWGREHLLREHTDELPSFTNDEQ